MRLTRPNVRRATRRASSAANPWPTCRSVSMSVAIELTLETPSSKKQVSRVVILRTMLVPCLPGGRPFTNSPIHQFTIHDSRITNSPIGSTGFCRVLQSSPASARNLIEPGRTLWNLGEPNRTQEKDPKAPCVMLAVHGPDSSGILRSRARTHRFGMFAQEDGHESDGRRVVVNGLGIYPR